MKTKYRIYAQPKHGAQGGPHYVLDDFGRELLFTSKKAAENYMNDEIAHLRPYWDLVVR
jgi:hypothetical protein